MLCLLRVLIVYFWELYLNGKDEVERVGPPDSVVACGSADSDLTNPRFYIDIYVHA